MQVFVTVLLPQLLHLSSHIHYRKAPQTTSHLQLFVHQSPVLRLHLLRLRLLNSACKRPSWLACPLCVGSKPNPEAYHFQSTFVMCPSTDFFFLFQCNKTSRLICMYIIKVTFMKRHLREKCFSKEVPDRLFVLDVLNTPLTH